MKRIKIQKDLANVYFVSILTYLGCFITIDNNYFNGYNYIKLGCMLILLIYVIFYSRVMLNARYLKTNFCFFILSLLIIISSYVNNNYPYSSGNYLISGINFIFTILLMLFTAEFASYKKQMNALINMYYILTICVVVLTDMFVFLDPNKSIIANDMYFIGTKFTVSYFHLFLIGFYVLKQKSIKLKNIFFIFILCLIAILASIKVDCMTGIVGVFSFLIIYVFFDKFSYIMTRPYIYVLTLIVSGLFVIFYSVIMRIGFVENFLENVLHTSTELTGRTWIYSILPLILSQKMWLGNGFRSSFDVMMHTMHAPNTQNGLTEWLLEGGILTTVAFLFFVWAVFKKVNYIGIEYKTNKMKVLYSMMYVLAILSTVEIMLNREIYFMWLLILFGFLNERKK